MVISTLLEALPLTKGRYVVLVAAYEINFLAVALVFFSFSFTLSSVDWSASAPCTVVYSVNVSVNIIINNVNNNKKE